MRRTLIALGLMLLLMVRAQAGEIPENNPAYLPLVARPIPTPGPPQPVSAERERLVELINAYRATTACPKLTTDFRLMVSAQLHAQDLLTNNYFNTTGLDGSSMIERAARQGYISDPFRGMTEVLGAQHVSPEVVMDDWSNSPIRFLALYNCNYTHIGVGHVYDPNDTKPIVVQHYWVADFAGPPE